MIASAIPASSASNSFERPVTLPDTCKADATARDAASTIINAATLWTTVCVVVAITMPCPTPRVCAHRSAGTTPNL